MGDIALHIQSFIFGAFYAGVAMALMDAAMYAIRLVRERL